MIGTDEPTVNGLMLGVVFGSGFGPGDVDANLTPQEIGTSWGKVVVHCRDDVVYLRRHGATASVAAHRIDHRRNVAALCAAGCDRVLGVASVGSLGRAAVGDVVVPDDLLACGATDSFFDDPRGHQVLGFDPVWRRRVAAAWARASPTPGRDGGVYAQTRGPRFETPAEVRVLAQHADVVGMTVASECFLAAEAGLAYAAVCQVDNLANGLDPGPLSLAVLDAARAEHGGSFRATLRQVIAVLAASGRGRAGKP